MKTWDVAASAHLAEGKALGFQLGSGDWPLKGFVVRHDGGCHAWVNSCPHAGHSLNYGPNDFMTPDGGYIRCLSHGAKFEPDTGACVAGPCPGQYLQRLECHEDRGIIRVRAPASARDL